MEHMVLRYDGVAQTHYYPRPQLGPTSTCTCILDHILYYHMDYMHIIEFSTTTCMRSTYQIPAA
eukprot:SAG11_NODE_8388_length_1021_cov_3.080260_1_plen_64_part_00